MTNLLWIEGRKKIAPLSRQTVVELGAVRNMVSPPTETRNGLCPKLEHHHRPCAGMRGDVQVPIDHHSPLAHADQAKVPGLVSLCFGHPYPIILYD